MWLRPPNLNTLCRYVSEKYGHEFDAIQIHTKNDCSHLPDNQHDQDTDLSVGPCGNVYILRLPFSFMSHHTGPKKRPREKNPSFITMCYKTFTLVLLGCTFDAWVSFTPLILGTNCRGRSNANNSERNNLVRNFSLKRNKDYVLRSNKHQKCHSYGIKWRSQFFNYINEYVLCYRWNKQIAYIQNCIPVPVPHFLIINLTKIVNRIFF